MTECERCKARERLLERAAGNRRMIDPELWRQLHGHTEKLGDWDKETAKVYVEGLRAMHDERHTDGD